ncbi:hypothetical protein NicSoilC12_38190 [Arthrobacter sp. NicSoilC12]|nr:hypothetical protein NicSoilC12_38190 [Arthrobacter sp. NicSoilC12]
MWEFEAPTATGQLGGMAGDGGRSQFTLAKTWFSLCFNQLAGVRWRGRLLGPGRAVAELRTPWPCVSTTMLL